MDRDSPIGVLMCSRPEPTLHELDWIARLSPLTRSGGLGDVWELILFCIFCNVIKFESLEHEGSGPLRFLAFLCKLLPSRCPSAGRPIFLSILEQGIGSNFGWLLIPGSSWIRV